MTPMSSPDGVAVDGAGDLFIADSGNNVVREVNHATGDHHHVAGNGTAGYSGDGGPATAAELNVPDGVAVDAAGDLFIADTDNNVVREVINDRDHHHRRRQRHRGYSGDGGPATAAELNGARRRRRRRGGRPVHRRHRQQRGPRGQSRRPGSSSPSPATAPPATAATAAGHRRRAELPRTASPSTAGRPVHRRHRQQRDPRGQSRRPAIIITVAGNGTAGYSGDGGPATAAELNVPDGVAVDAAGDLFIADTDNNVIREVDQGDRRSSSPSPATAPAGYSGDGGPATAAELNGPDGVAVDAAGDLFIADTATT